MTHPKPSRAPSFRGVGKEGGGAIPAPPLFFWGGVANFVHFLCWPNVLGKRSVQKNLFEKSHLKRLPLEKFLPTPLSLPTRTQLPTLPPYSLPQLASQAQWRHLTGKPRVVELSRLGGKEAEEARRVQSESGRRGTKYMWTYLSFWTHYTQQTLDFTKSE